MRSPSEERCLRLARPKTLQELYCIDYRSEINSMKVGI